MKRFDGQLLQELHQRAQLSPRRRAHHNVHEDYHQPVQRLFVSMCRESYVRPHRHSDRNKWEFFLVVQGCVDVLLFNADGQLKERLTLAAGSDCFGVEIPANTWHSVVCSDTATFLEVKQGPYAVADDKDFADWAPNEGDVQVPDFLAALKLLIPGQSVSDALVA